MGNPTSFGALTDHFGLATATLILVDSNKKPVAQARADAKDEKDDVAATAYYGNTAGALFDVDVTYALKSGTLDLSTLFLGELSVGIIASALDADTASAKWPEIKITGQLGNSAVVAPTGFTNKFAVPAVVLTGAKIAQLMGFTIQAGKLTGCKLSAKIEIGKQTDGVGEPIAFGLSGGTGTVDATFVRITDTPAWTVTAGYLTQIAAPGRDEKQATFHTATGSAGFTLARIAAT